MPEKVYDLQDYNHPLYWKFIPSATRYVVEDLTVAFDKIIAKMKWKEKKYSNGGTYFDSQAIDILDVGCGIGNVLQIAEVLFLLKYPQFDYRNDDNEKKISLRCTGIEHDKRLADMARENRVGCITNIDALKFENYGGYDIIHYYRPIKETKMMTELENKIETQAKKGSIIIARLKADFAMSKNEKFKMIKKDESWSSSGAYIFTKVK